MLSGISVICFAASYGVALVLEVVRLFTRAKISVILSLSFTAAGLVAHTLYLIAEQGDILGTGSVSSWHQWGMMAAWFMTSTYLLLAISQPQNSLGLFILPLILLSVGATYLSDQVAPFGTDETIKAWGQIHGFALMTGTVVVAMGFITGIMYLIQSYRLKHKMLKQEGLKLPSLEWLESSNRRALIVSTALIAVGLFSGILLKIGKDSFPWTDPVVWSSGILFLWLVAATIFELVYKPARQGQKVAYLTLANFLFLALVLGLLFFGPSEHARSNDGSPDKAGSVYYYGTIIQAIADDSSNEEPSV
ncbi:MAG: cytochrome c biogenesis protein CcsA [Pirellulales bacterium]